MVHVGEGAPHLAIGGEVLLEPSSSGGNPDHSGLSSQLLLRATTCQDPTRRSSSPLGVARGLPEVLEVASGPLGVVLVVAGDWPGALLEPPPRRPVAFLEVRHEPLG